MTVRIEESKPCPRCQDTGEIEVRRPGGGWYKQECPLINQPWHR